MLFSLKLQLRIVLCLSCWVGIFTVAHGETLSDAILKAFAASKQMLELPKASNRLDAQNQSIIQIQNRREIAAKTAYAYSALYFAKRHQFVSESRLKFANQQSELEELRFAQGLTTLSNLERVRAYRLEAEKLFLASRRNTENAERNYFADVGEAPPQYFKVLELGKDISSLRDALEQINLSHPQLMPHAYRIKNTRSIYETRKSKAGYLKKLKELDALVLGYETSFEKALQTITREAEGMYRNHVWYKKEMAIEKRKIHTTRNLFNAVLEARKHQLKTTPEVLAAFDEAIKARTDFLESDWKSKETMISLLSLMGKLVPEQFNYRQKLAWRKTMRKHAFIMVEQNGR